MNNELENIKKEEVETPEQESSTQESLSARYALDNSVNTRNNTSNDGSSAALPSLSIEDAGRKPQTSEQEHSAQENVSAPESNERPGAKPTNSPDESVSGPAENGALPETRANEKGHEDDENDADDVQFVAHLDERRVVNNGDGSRVEFDRATDLPVLSVDSNGNEYRYSWDNGSGAPSYVSMQGPRTGGQLVEFRANTLVDTTINVLSNPLSYLGLPSLLVTPLQPQTNYTVSVDGREQPATLNMGAGAGVNAGPAALTAGISMPIQRNVDLRVRADGSLQIMQPAETVNGTVQNRRLILSNNMDGSTTQEVRTGWLSASSHTVRRDRNGRVID